MVATFSEPQSWTEDDELKLQLVEAELSAREAKRERSIAARDNFAAFVQASWDIV